MKLIVDCGATKTLWHLVDGHSGREVETAGFNLAHTPEPVLHKVLGEAAAALGPGIDEIHFYAAGLVGESPVDLGRWFPGARIEYASDLVGAARAVCQRESGVAAIIGTGANTCQWDGRGIVRAIRCGGFILGDEGSASVLGRLFVADFLKERVPQTLANAFTERFQADYPTIVKAVYGGAAPARYLGSFAPFILEYYPREEYAKELVDSNFRGLFERTLTRYENLPVGVVGGFGYACRDILQAMAPAYGIRFSRFMKSPVEGLLLYHGL